VTSYSFWNKPLPGIAGAVRKARGGILLNALRSGMDRDQTCTNHTPDDLRLRSNPRKNEDSPANFAAVRTHLSPLRMRTPKRLKTMRMTRRKYTKVLDRYVRPMGFTSAPQA
jgi:hypothetical protein